MGDAHVAERGEITEEERPYAPRVGRLGIKSVVDPAAEVVGPACPERDPPVGGELAVSVPRHGEDEASGESDLLAKRPVERFRGEHP